MPGADPRPLALVAAPAVALTGVRFAYPGGGPRWEIPEFTVAAGARVALTGRSGAGKTTLLHLLAGILLPQVGRVEVAGTTLGDISPAARRRFRATRIGLIFQEFELLEYLSVRENILLPFLVHRGLGSTGGGGPHTARTAIEDRLSQLADHAGLTRHLARKPRVLSQGERQRVAVCRALITRPALVLADEPTGNLDAETTDAVLESIFQETSAAGATLVMVTHARELVGRFERVVDMATLSRPGSEAGQP